MKTIDKAFLILVLITILYIVYFVKTNLLGSSSGSSSDSNAGPQMPEKSVNYAGQRVEQPKTEQEAIKYLTDSGILPRYNR